MLTPAVHDHFTAVGISMTAGLPKCRQQPNFMVGPEVTTVMNIASDQLHSNAT
jgi:hypothetical protein